MNKQTVHPVVKMCSNCSYFLIFFYLSRVDWYLDTSKHRLFLRRNLVATTSVKSVTIKTIWLPTWVLKRINVKLDNPNRLGQCGVAIEDHRFFNHRGSTLFVLEEPSSVTSEGSPADLLHSLIDQAHLLLYFVRPNPISIQAWLATQLETKSNQTGILTYYILKEMLHV